MNSAHLVLKKEHSARTSGTQTITTTEQVTQNNSMSWAWFLSCQLFRGCFLCYKGKQINKGQLMRLYNFIVIIIGQKPQASFHIPGSPILVDGLQSSVLALGKTRKRLVLYCIGSTLFAKHLSHYSKNMYHMLLVQAQVPYMQGLVTQQWAKQ